MKKVHCDMQDSVAVLTLSNGVVNAISIDVVDDLAEQIESARIHAKGIVLRGNDKFFSSGFELETVVHYSKEQMTLFFRKFNDVLLALYTMPFPTVSLLSGHAVAGGNILALCTDYRFASSENKKIGLNEIKLGVSVPYFADLLLKQIVGNHRAKEMMYSGEFMAFSKALEMGLIDHKIPDDQILDECIKRIVDDYDNRIAAFQEIKQNRTEEIVANYSQRRLCKDSRFIDLWFSDRTQTILQNAVAAVKK